jgi:hypothetical protein
MKSSTSADDCKPLHIALAATVHALALSLLYHAGSDSCLALRASSEPLERHTQAVGDSPAHQAMAEEGERWGEHLPGEASDLFAWCLAQSGSSENLPERVR